jgi:hypothetical protein
MQQKPKEVKAFSFSGKCVAYDAGGVDVVEPDIIKVVFPVDGIPFKH